MNLNETFDRLTLGEIAKIEELSGASIAAIGDEETPKGKALAAVAFVVKRRTNPTFTWNEAMGLTLAEAFGVLGIEEDPEEAADPTEPALADPSPSE